MTIRDFTMKDVQGRPAPLAQYDGKVLLIVNTATECGLTPQLEGLEALEARFAPRGFAVLGFPCNQFRGQAPGTDEEISAFCKLHYGTTFPSFAKLDVNGDGADPLYVHLKGQAPDEREDDDAKAFRRKLTGMGLWNEGSDIHWNFTKFLIDRGGRVAARFSPGCAPASLADHIEALL